MKELLYIPHGSYVSFLDPDYNLVSYGEFVKKHNQFTFEVMMSWLTNNKFVPEFYKRNDLPHGSYLTVEQFEVIDR